MKKILKNTGIQTALNLISLCFFAYDLMPENSFGDLIDPVFRKVESFADRLFAVSYDGSQQEESDALCLAFGDDWKAYSDFQMMIIQQTFGIKPAFDANHNN